MRDNRHKRGYTNKWAKAAKSYLASHPWCVICQKTGKFTPATCVDHIVPHKRDMQLFWDTSNWQALCDPHHNSTKQRDERRGYVTGSDATGMPIDPEHHWNK